MCWLSTLCCWEAAFNPWISWKTEKYSIWVQEINQQTTNLFDSIDVLSSSCETVRLPPPLDPNAQFDRDVGPSVMFSLIDALGNFIRVRSIGVFSYVLRRPVARVIVQPSSGAFFSSFGLLILRRGSHSLCLTKEMNTLSENFSHHFSHFLASALHCTSYIRQNIGNWHHFSTNLLLISFHGTQNWTKHGIWYQTVFLQFNAQPDSPRLKNYNRNWPQDTRLKLHIVVCTLGGGFHGAVFKPDGYH